MSEMVKPANWADYDHLQVAAMEDPVAVLSELRKTCPVGHSEQHGGFYVLTRYADCIAAAKDTRFSSSPDLGPGPGFPYSAKQADLLRMGMITDDGQRHRDFRLPLSKIFSVKFAAALAPKITTICDDLIDGFIEVGRADLSDQYTIELPAILISDLLDLPIERRREFQGWACEMVAKADMQVMQKLVDYTDELYEFRTQNRGEDIPSLMLDFIIDGRPITKDEWRGLVLLLILGGLDTTANGGGFIFHMIAQKPELRKYLLQDRSRIQKVTKELLRMVSPVPQHSRGVTEDLELGGHQFRKGDVVQLNWLAANHDPEIFENPDQMIPDRKVDHHLAFGNGPHRCLGSYLALVELQIMIERVLERLPDYTLIEGGTERFPSLNRGMSHLRIAFTPGIRLRPLA